MSAHSDAPNSESTRQMMFQWMTSRRMNRRSMALTLSNETDNDAVKEARVQVERFVRLKILELPAPYLYSNSFVAYAAESVLCLTFPGLKEGRCEFDVNVLARRLRHMTDDEFGYHCRRATDSQHAAYRATIVPGTHRRMVLCRATNSYHVTIVPGTRPRVVLPRVNPQ